MWKTGFVSVMLVTVGVLFSQTASFGCTVCHSKNPNMVAMHSMRENKTCFRCHGGRKIKSKEELPRQMTTDPLCRECHKK